MKSLPSVHVFLFAIFPVVFLFSHNVEQVVFSDAITSLFVVFTVSAVVFFLFRFVFRDGEKVALATTLFLILFFSYGHAFEPEPGAYWIRHRYMLIIWIGLFSIGIYYLIRTKRNLQPLTKALNVVSLVLVAFSLGSITAYEYGVVKNRSMTRNDGVPFDKVTTQAEARPDIYYIILDAYASNPVLQREIGYDNSKFLNYLTGKGFFVVPDANSNYSATHLSLPSSLNMDYLQNISTKPGEVSTQTVNTRQLIENSAVQRFLKRQGYAYVQFGSNWQATYTNKFADENFTMGYLSEFLRILYKTTALYPIGRKFDIFNDRRIQYEGILSHFDHLGEMPDRLGPTFIFAHLMVPHPPYVFAEDGSFIQTEQSEEEEKKAYRDQLIFLNKKLEALIDDILTTSKHPPIIILQGDHGSRLEPRGNIASPEKLYDWYIKERMGNLSAYYLPGGGKKALYDSITPVNSFRVIFNYYFGADFELLPDESYLAPPWGDGYDLIRVTNTICQKGCR